MTRDRRDPWWEDAACRGMAPMFDALPDDIPRGRARVAHREATSARHARAAAVCLSIAGLNAAGLILWRWLGAKIDRAFTAIEPWS